MGELQQRVTDYELLILSDQSYLLELYHTFCRDYFGIDAVEIESEIIQNQLSEQSADLSQSELSLPGDVVPESAHLFLEKKKEEVQEKRNKDLELLREDTLDGLITKALAEKDRELEILKSKLLIAEEDLNWSKVRLDLSEKNLVYV